MIAPLAKFIDWSAIQVLCGIEALLMSKPHVNLRNPRLAEAIQFLNGPEFIPAESQPARVEFNPNQSGMHFRFPTPRPGDFTENNIVYGRLYRCAERWQKQPVIVLLHGGGDFLNHRFRFPLIAHRCNRVGFNAATLVAPYHFQRYPRQLGAGKLSGPDYLLDAKAFAQAVAEIRALTGWLLEEGCPAVAVWGISYGGWLAGLTVCHEERLASVVLSVPKVHMNHHSIAEVVIWRLIREAMQERRVARQMLNRTPLNLTLVQPAIPKENILLVDATQDLFLGKEPIEELWQAWRQPDIWRLSHGHVSALGKPGLTAGVLRWLAPRLDKPAVLTGQTPIAR